MYNTYVKAVRDLRNNYPEVAQIIKNRDHVIITNNGKSEAVVIPYEQLEEYQEYLHFRYIKDKLAEAEAIADNPNEWVSIDDVLKNWDSWGAKK
ncbi:MAG: type II toxin-antitoxin system Phd/YefM family antitoxin [Oscillospiraceae bacterium]|nr:type II toxin-antitoxin system Phd/YefM family antitoxin [Oscillospiraceae bacterium]